MGRARARRGVRSGTRADMFLLLAVAGGIDAHAALICRTRVWGIIGEGPSVGYSAPWRSWTVLALARRDGRTPERVVERRAHGVICPGGGRGTGESVVVESQDNGLPLAPGPFMRCQDPGH